MRGIKNYFNKNKISVLIFVIACLIGSVIYFMFERFGSSDLERKPYVEFLDSLKKGDVEFITYSSGRDDMTYTTGSGDKYVTTYPDYEEFRKEMLESGVKIKKAKKLSMNIVFVIVETLALIFYIIVILMLRFDFGKLKSKDIVQKSDVKFENVIGLEEIMDDVSLYISMIKSPDLGEEIGAKIPKGLLLAGAPGTGKTLIAKAIAGEADVPFISVSGSEFAEMLKGMGAKRVRNVFKIARKNAPCIVFIDEIDAIGGDRNSFEIDSEDTQTINQLLKEMDGFNELEGVFVLAATNCPDKLDPALKRSGRFDRQINVNPPRDWKVRKQMLEYYFKDYKVSKEVDLDRLAKTISGFTGADIAMICNESGLTAIMNKKHEIDMDCIEEAIDKKIFNGNRSKSEQYIKDKEIAAYHEAGHAVVKYLLGESISRASIISTTSGVGGAVFGEEKEGKFKTKKDIRNEVMVCFGGRTSEQIKFSEITTGSASDIKQATERLIEYVSKYGFDEEVGPINVDALIKEDIMDLSIVSERVQLLARDIEKETDIMLRDNFNLVEKLAQKLMEEETMSGVEIKKLLNN